jgi:predicted PurR-regulated permease PerM
LIKHIFFFTLLIAASLAFLFLLRPFFEPLLWAVTLAVLFSPLHKFILNKFKGRHSLSAFITLLLILFTVVVPASTLSVAVVNEGTNLYSEIRSGVYDFSKPIAWVQKSLPIVSESLSKVGIDFEKLKSGFSDTAVNSSHWVATNLLNIGQNALTFTVLFLLMLYLLFFFLRDGHNIVELIIRVLPIGDEAERHLLSKFAEVSRATIKGTLVVGIIQGTLGGIIFALLGIESAVFWGVVMIGLSILPAVGSALVWGPAAIIFLANGHWGKALILFIVGALIIGMIDNVLRPILVGRDTKMPDYLILLSTLGGLAIFGLSGFVVGPVIAAFFLAIWVMFEAEYHPDSMK